MSASASHHNMRPALAASVRLTDSRLSVELTDGREIGVPLSEFPELLSATAQQRANWQISDFGTAIYWPDLDEEIGLAVLLGVPETMLEEAAGFTIYNREPSESR